MASYTKDQVAAANLPVADIRSRLKVGPGKKGHQSHFWNHVMRFHLAATGKALSDHEIDTQSGNNAYNFNLFADGKTDTLSTGNNTTLQDILTAWAALNNGAINLDATIPTSSETGNMPLNGNGNGNGSKPASVTSQPTGTETRRAAENVPPVSQNVFASALKVFDGLRSQDPAFPIPSNADDAYGLLWDHLAEPVRSGRASGVISDTLANLVTTNRDLFNGIVTVLPDDVKDAIEEALIDRAYDTYRASLKTTVEDVYHISKGQMHASRYFAAWATQVAEIANWAGRDEPLGWKPNEDQMREANRNHAVTAFRNLATGLRAERASVEVQPEPETTPVLQPIQFNNIMGRLLTKGPEIMAEVGGRWGSMTPAQQHEFVAQMDAEDAAKVAAETPAESTEVVPVEDPKPETPAAPPAQPRNRQNQPKG